MSSSFLYRSSSGVAALRPVLGLVVLLLSLCGGCSRGEGERGGSTSSAEAAEGAAESVPIEVVTVRTGAVSDTVLATATLTSQREVTVLSGANGQLVSLEVEEGERVEEKQLLGRVRNDELALAVDRARASVRRAEAEVARLRPLNEKGYIPRAEYDRAQTEAEIAREELKRAQVGAAETVLRAPIGGVVAVRHIDPGAQITATQPIVTLLDPDALEAVVQVPERVLGQLRLGQRAQIVSEALGKHRPFPGRIERIAPTVDPLTGTLKVEVVLEEISDGVSEHKLRPGMFVEVRIVTDTRPDVPLVPKRAVLFEDTRPYVFVARDGFARLAWIETGAAGGEDLVEVRSGLTAGAEVVVLGQAALKDGTPLRILRRDGAPSSPAPGADAATTP